MPRLRQAIKTMPEDSKQVVEKTPLLSALALAQQDWFPNAAFDHICDWAEQTTSHS